MAVDDYNPGSSLAAYFPSRDERRVARLWAREKTLHDLADLGAVDFFEGGGSDPTVLPGYAADKLWLRVDPGVTDAPGTVRYYGGGDATLLASWPEMDRAGFASHVDTPLSTALDALGASVASIIASGDASVLDMAAAGTPNNGVDDDYPTFQALYDKAVAAGGGCILLPDGPLRFNSTPVIAHPRIAVIGRGAGATRWLNAQRTSSFIRLSGADVHSIEIAGIQFESLGGASAPQTAGGVFSFERHASGAGVFDVKIHHVTTFYAYHVLTSAYSTQAAATPFLDIMVSDFCLRDMVQCGFYLDGMAGTKIARGAVSFAAPQTTQPAAGSSGIYVGDWVDGLWISDVNCLGGETSMDFGSNRSTNKRKPAAVITSGLSVDSGWLQTLRFRACKSVEMTGTYVGDLAGNSASMRVEGAGATFDAENGVDDLRFNGGVIANGNGAGIELVGNSRHVYFTGTLVESNGRGSAAGAYNNVYVGPNVSNWGIHGCRFRSDTTWFGANKPGYHMFVDTGCNDYYIVNNSMPASEAVNGALYNGSSAATRANVSGNNDGSSLPSAVGRSGAVSANQLAAWVDSTQVRASGVYESGGSIGIKTSSPQVGVDIADGSETGGVRIGADVNATTYTANLRKTGRIVGPSFAGAGVGTNVMVIGIDSNSASATYLDIGGAPGGTPYAVTDVRFLTAPTVTTAGGTERLRINSSGNVGIGITSPSTTLHVSGPIRCGSYTVATLPSAATVGAGSIALVTDATETTFATTVVGGGANKVPVYSDGAAWKIG